MYDFQNRDDVQAAKVAAMSEVDPSILCDFLNVCESELADPALELDEMLQGFVEKHRPGNVETDPNQLELIKPARRRRTR